MVIAPGFAFASVYHSFSQPLSLYLNLIIDFRLRQSLIGRRYERRNNTMYDLSIIWIALLVLIAVGTFLSTRLYARFGKGKQRRGNRLNTLRSLLYQL